MAEIKPFKGILYSRKKIDIAKVVTPPYDIISPSMQNRFYQRDEHNIIRLILGKQRMDDTRRNNRYVRAGLLLDKWLKNKIFIKDKRPSFYIYTQEYLCKGRKRTRIGFIALMRIEDPRESGVLPHEYTLDKPKQDRLNLITKTQANLSPIFSLFQDKRNRVNKVIRAFIGSRDPVFTVEAEGVIHRLWRMDSKSAINRIKCEMQDKKIFIADGHHRYEVALTYSEKVRRSRRFRRNMNYVMMYFSDLSERGNLTILSTHRVVKNIRHFNGKKMIRKLSKCFYIKKVKNVENVIRHLEGKKRHKHSFGAYLGRNAFYILKLKAECSIDALIDASKISSLKKLDVTILHDFIINKILGINNRGGSVKYIRNERDAVTLIDKGDYQVAFFLSPTGIMEMKAVAERGQMMPQKSTYFYPKLLTGLVINKF